MTVTYNALVQKDVNRILKRYDSISARLGDEFWSELTSKIEATAQNPGRSHPAGGISVALILQGSRTTFCSACSQGEFGSRSSDITNGALPTHEREGERTLH
jgi:hypothetical protein